MCTVGVVFPSSPAHAAGLRAGDSLLAFAHVQHAEWISVAESVVPLVKASVGKPIPSDATVRAMMAVALPPGKPADLPAADTPATALYNDFQLRSVPLATYSGSHLVHIFTRNPYWCMCTSPFSPRMSCSPA